MSLQQHGGGKKEDEARAFEQIVKTEATLPDEAIQDYENYSRMRKHHPHQYSD